jgi:glycosyltransferase involved in cell wall biosynthesis
VVRDLLAVLPGLAASHEVIVVDDGSSDGTAATVARLAAEQPGVRLVRHGESRGYGAALRSGFAAAREPWAFFTDGDGQFDAREIGRLATAAEGADLVAGCRVRRADPALRRAGGKRWNTLVDAVLGVRVRDVNCAFKLVRREVLAVLSPVSTGALVNTELLGKALGRGFRLRQVAVSHRPRRHGRATGGSPRVALCALRELVQLAGSIRASVEREPAAGSAAQVAFHARHLDRLPIAQPGRRGLESVGDRRHAAVPAGGGSAIEELRERLALPSGDHA